MTKKNSRALYDASVFNSLRSMHPGRSSTIRKAIRLRRIEAGLRPLNVRRAVINGLVLHPTKGFRKA